MSNIILCVDPGPLKNGYALLNTKDWIVVEHGIKTWDELSDLAWNYPGLSGIAVEKAIMYSFPGAKVGPNNKTVVETAFNCGRLLEISKKLGIVYKEKTRIEILEDISGKKARGQGNKISKAEAQEFVKKMLNLDHSIRPQHCNDAVCVGLSLWDHPNVQSNRKKNEQLSTKKKIKRVRKNT